MTIGRTISKDELNNTVAAVVQSLFATMDNVVQAKAVLDGYSAADLQNVFGFAEADANLIKSVYTDLDQLRNVFIGAGTQATTYDFRTFAKRALGTGLY